MPLGDKQNQNEEKVLCEVYKKANFLPASPSNYCPHHANNKSISVNNNNNNNLQLVTQELVNIIKNFQKQLWEVPTKPQNSQMEEIPSGVLEPKYKEFFKLKEIATQKPQESDNKKELKKDSSKTSNEKKESIRSKSSSRSISSKVNSFRRSATSQSLSKSVSSTRKLRSSSVNADPLKLIKDEVQRAIRDNKTFTIKGQFPAIRRALLDRGWIEKYHVSYRDQLSQELKRYQTYSISELLSLSKDKDLTTLCKNLIKSKLLGSYQVDLYWGMSDEAFKENPDKIKFTLINKLKRDIFSYTNKLGLCDSNKNAHWYQIPDVSKLNHPRSYNLGKNGDKKGFIDDFHVTSAMSLLKWICETNITKECKLISPSGKIPLEVFEFALNECCKFVKRAKHEDIDAVIVDAKEEEWNQFIEYFYKIVHYSNHFKSEKGKTEDSLIKKSAYMLNSLKEYYPYLDMDGMMNIWILKPTSSSRGRGIHICRTLQYILKIVNQNSNIRYIIQKYIERPLLIHKTKFDIRQWFLISSTTPLTIWIYKECYLRFSSQTYNLRKLHESIHLTNNAVQRKYKNTSVDAALPSYNMWDLKTFENYLSNIGYPNAVKQIIYPGMKQCITAAVLMHQDKMVVRKNCFELYGADFILTEDFQPWLLEINSNPALYASTPVTSRLCPKVLEDVIKVVIDYKNNTKADTGGFEMMYKEKVDRLPRTENLEVQGKPVTTQYFCNPKEIQPHIKQIARIQQKPALEKPKPNAAQNMLTMEQQECFKRFGNEIKETLKNLLDIIHNEKHKRELKHQKVGCDNF